MSTSGVFCTSGDVQYSFYQLAPPHASWLPWQQGKAYLYQAISIDARKDVWVSAIFSDRNSFKRYLLWASAKRT